MDIDRDLYFLKIQCATVEEARKRAEEARKCADDRASELEVRVSRMTQSAKDVKVAVNK